MQLAGEEREHDARSKAEQLMVAFDASFKLIEACRTLRKDLKRVGQGRAVGASLLTMELFL